MANLFMLQNVPPTTQTCVYTGVDIDICNG